MTVSAEMIFKAWELPIKRLALQILLMILGTPLAELMIASRAGSSNIV